MLWSSTPQTPVEDGLHSENNSLSGWLKVILYIYGNYFFDNHTGIFLQQRQQAEDESNK